MKSAISLPPVSSTRSEVGGGSEGRAASVPSASSPPAAGAAKRHGASKGLLDRPSKGAHAVVCPRVEPVISNDKGVDSPAPESSAHKALLDKLHQSLNKDLAAFTASLQKQVNDAVQELGRLGPAILDNQSNGSARVGSISSQPSSKGDELSRVKRENQELRKKLRNYEMQQTASRNMTSKRPPKRGSSLVTSSSDLETHMTEKTVDGETASLRSGGVRFSESPTASQNPSSGNPGGVIRLVAFFDLDPTCDDETALLYMLAELNNNKKRAIIDLIVTDSDVRFLWMAYLFADKFKEGGGWMLGFDGTFITIGMVTVHLYFMKSQKEALVREDFKKKVPQIFLEDEEGKVNEEQVVLHGMDLSDVPAGVVDGILLAAPCAELDPGFFSRFEGVRAVYVVGTPGGVNCPQPSWSGLLYALHQLGPVVYLAPQFTRTVRFPKDYVEDNPHWPWFMKRTVFDSALTVMARRPEIPAKFGNWGLILRLNAANAVICQGWYKDVMGKEIEPVEHCEASVKTIVQAYVDRNSGSDRQPGAVAEELRMIGCNTEANLNDKGQPVTPEDAEVLRREYRDELFTAVYICVITTETLLFQNQANLKPTSGEHHFLTLHPRCGYADPHQSLATIFGVDEAIDIVKNLPLSSLTPAYDMVGAICLLSYLETDDLSSMSLEVQVAEDKIGAGLFSGQEDAAPENGIYVVPEQSGEVVDEVTEWLRSHIDTDPLVLLDDFWAKFKTVHGHSSAYGRRDSESARPRNFRMSAVMNQVQVTTEQAGDTPAWEIWIMTHLISHPSSNKQLWWALISMVFILYDCFAVPMQAFAFEDPPNVLITVAAFWALDLFYTFFTGYYSMGVIEMRPRRIWINYLKSWFVLDLTLVCTDWVLLMFLTDGNNKFVALLRTRRVIRLARLLKVSKVERIVTGIRDMFPGTGVDYSLKIIRMMCLIFGITHAIACGWFWIGATVGESDPGALTWIRNINLEEEDIPLQYFISMHWAFARLLLGEMDVPAKTLPERIYSVAILMVGLIIFSYFVSSINEYMSRIAEAQSMYKSQDAEVSRFMEDHGISSLLTAQVANYRRHARHNDQRALLPKEEIAGLQDLPEALSVWLSKEVFLGTVSEHGFFQVIHDHHPNDCAMMLHRTMQECSTRKGEDIFLKGQKVDKVFIFMKGQANYRKDDFEWRPQRGTWLSEYALWLGGFKRRGDCEAQSLVSLHAISLADFQKFCSDNLTVGYLACEFAGMVASLKVPFSKLNDVSLDLADRARLAGELEANVEGKGSVDHSWL